MKIGLTLICAVGLLAIEAQAQSPVTLTVDTQARGPMVQPDFAGASIFTGAQTRDHRGPGNLFSGTNLQLITLFKNTGLHHLRLGATGSPTSGTENLSHEDIDALFSFAKATDVKIIYSLHFAGGVDTAKYVWDHYQPWLDCFAFDNEPDSRLNDDSAAAAAGRQNYFVSWKDFAASVTAAVPGAKFAGPDAAGRTLSLRFVKKEKDSGNLALVTQHFYVGGNSRKHGVDAPHAIESMLSKAWVNTNYPQFYDAALQKVVKRGLPFRVTEFNDYVHGVTNGSDAFASALWALDSLHWWAERGARGVNFQNTQWLPTDTFSRDTNGNCKIYPKAYGIKAFDLGSHGAVEPVAIGNSNQLNLTAYAIGDTTNLYVTIINKEHGAGARSASVTILGKGLENLPNAAAMFLTASNGDAGATSGITLGGGTITNNAPWSGQWTALSPSAKGECVLTVPAASAAVVRLSSHF